MEHLTRDEMMRFVNVASSDAEACAVVNRVNKHILECRECASALRRARAFSDAVKAMSREDFEPSLLDLISCDIPAEQVALAAAEESEKNVLHNYR